MRVLPYRAVDQAVQGVVMTFTDVTDLIETTRRLALRERQQGLVATLGREALAGKDLPELIDLAARETKETLRADFGIVLERSEQGDSLLLSAGVGWKPGLVGSHSIAAEDGSAPAVALRGHSPLVIENMAKDPRFQRNKLLRDHDVTSGVLVRVDTRERGVRSPGRVYPSRPDVYPG